MFDCSNPEALSVPSLEGTGGTFYRIIPDLQNANRFPDGYIAEIEKLSVALSSNGTELIVVPIPTKALAMPAYLPDRAKALDYDHRLASVMYADNLRRLKQPFYHYDRRFGCFAGFDENERHFSQLTHG